PLKAAGAVTRREDVRAPRPGALSHGPEGKSRRCAVTHRNSSMTIDSKIPNLRNQIVVQGQGGAADPLGVLIAILPDDPLIADFIALRRSRPDLRELDPLHMQAAARMCFYAGESLACHQAWRFDRTPLPEHWI